MTFDEKKCAFYARGKWFGFHPITRYSMTVLAVSWLLPPLLAIVGLDLRWLAAFFLSVFVTIFWCVDLSDKAGGVFGYRSATEAFAAAQEWERQVSIWNEMCEEDHYDSGELVILGSGTKADPDRYVVNEAILDAVDAGKWNTGMLDALVAFARSALKEEKRRHLPGCQ